MLAGRMRTSGFVCALFAIIASNLLWHRSARHNPFFRQSPYFSTQVATLAGRRHARVAKPAACLAKGPFVRRHVLLARTGNAKRADVTNSASSVSSATRRMAETAALARAIRHSWQEILFAPRTPRKPCSGTLERRARFDSFSIRLKLALMGSRPACPPDKLSALHRQSACGTRYTHLNGWLTGPRSQSVRRLWLLRSPSPCLRGCGATVC
jgi:hypothetical protein